MATTEEALGWLRNETKILEQCDANGMLPGVCPIIGRAVHHFHDYLGSVELRAEFCDPLAAALATSKDEAKETERRQAFAVWLRDVAVPAWTKYADLRADEDLDDVFAEAIAANQGNGVSSINSYLGASGTTAAAFAADLVVPNRTKDKAYLRQRARQGKVPVNTPKRGTVLVDGAPVAGVVEDAVSALKLKSRCFRLAFAQPASPTRTIEDLQESFALLCASLLGVTL